MPEPTSTTVAGVTYVASSISVPIITAFGVPLGIRPDVLIAGFFGSLVAIILLDTVPSEGDTWRLLAKTTFKRMAVAMASSLTAGYMTPLALQVVNLPDPMFLLAAFGVGGSAQRVLLMFIAKLGAPAPAAGGTRQ